jgi:nucleotide-binding universal stress UspA family protein
MTVVCGTDFSSLSGAAAHVAARLAHKLGDRVVLVCAHAPNADGDEGVRVIESSLEREREALAPLGALVETAAPAGDPAMALAQVAQDHSARIVVVGAAERAGRVPDRTAAQCGAPVLVVRNKTPLDAWIDGKRPLRVLLATAPDHSGAAGRALVGELRKVGTVDVVAVQVSFPPEDRRRLGLQHGLGSAIENDAPTERALLDELKRTVGDLPGQGEVRFLVKPTLEHVDDALLDVAASEAIDLIVVGSHHRTGLSRLWHGSVAEGVVRHARTNVMVAPYMAEKEPLPTVNSVLVPVDGTPLCGRSVALACTLAGPRGVVHLVEVADKDADREALVAAMKKLVPEGARALGTRIEAHVVHGADVAEALCGATMRLGADLVCMRAARTANQAAPLLLGSVTNAVLAKSQRPVVIVRDGG